MAIPNGYTLAEIGKTYTNVDYWIDTTVAPITFVGDTGLPGDFINVSLKDANDDGVFTFNFDSDSGANYGEYKNKRIYQVEYWDNISDGKIDGVDTISLVYTYITNSSNAVKSVVYNDWLYVKETPDYIAEPLYLESELQASKAVEVTGNGSVTVQPDSGFVAVKEVVVTTNVQGGDYVMSEVANATGTTVVFTYAGSGYTVTLTSDSQSTASSSSVAYTYLSTTQPTSALDYDYELLGTNKLYDNSESTTALTQPVTFNATELWIWGYGYKINGGSLVTTSNVYTSATKVTLSQNTSIALVNTYYSSD